jgi:hypothetical protein
MPFHLALGPPSSSNKVNKHNNIHPHKMETERMRLRVSRMTSLSSVLGFACINRIWW